jgi:hypothetical protein
VHEILTAKKRNAGKAMATLALAGVLATTSTPLHADQATTAPSTRPLFAEADAARILNEMRTALEANRRNHLLRLFDARRMPNYAEFRDEVIAFFEKYDSFQVQYQMKQVRMDGEFGAVLADFVLEAAPPNAGSPNVRRSVPVRLITAWDGKQWKIVDLSPRNLFQ